jgi:hypothetical protein
VVEGLDGQEAAVRLHHLLLACHLLGMQPQSFHALRPFIAAHAHRIAGTVGYARAQRNNHAISEASALFLAGAYLRRAGKVAGADRTAGSFELRGRRLLEDAVRSLITPDGSFSQHSMNYHRLMLDTLSLTEFWRRDLGAERFSPLFYERASAAADWLYQLIDPISGGAPCIGANDGALLAPLSGLSYADFRPSVQLSSALFCGGRALDPGPWDDVLHGLNLFCQTVQGARITRSCRVFKHGGYVRLQSPESERTWALIRFPRYHFRPSHADALHVDLWHNGVNLLRDGGTYSYNTNESVMSYFRGVESHNTVQFDHHDQMPRLGRFLYGDWLETDEVGELCETTRRASWTGSYTDAWGCHHRRTVRAQCRQWLVRDELSGFKECAILRWRLAPGSWLLEDNVCRGPDGTLCVGRVQGTIQCALRAGWESRHYGERTSLPVLEVTIKSSDLAIVETTISLG